MFIIVRSSFSFLCFLIFFSSIFAASAQEKKDYNIISIGFYNVENLFDIYDDPNTLDDDRTPKGKDGWTEKIYKDKLQKLAFAISQIGKEQTGQPPVLLGLCEVENREVLEDLVKQPLLAPFNYQIIHYDSPDARGIDVALLYQERYFEPENSIAHPLLLYDLKKPEKRVFTRDQLVVSGRLQGEKIHLIVNHWPSRSGGEKASSYKRENAAFLNRKIIDSLFQKDPYASIISMGDFNDDPRNTSLRKVLKAKDHQSNVGQKEIFNPMAALSAKGIGSLAYRDSWNLFDQILVSHSFLQQDYSKYSFYKAAVFNENYLTTPTGQFKGYPFRSFGNSGYTGGYSDHFPVYILLIREKNLEPGAPGNP